MEILDDRMKDYWKRHKSHMDSFDNVCLKFAEPDDIIFNGILNTYSATYSAYTEEHVFATIGGNRVPAGMAAIFIGWYCGENFEGYLEVVMEGIIRHKILIYDVYNNKNPLHYFFSTDIIHFRENDKCEFIIYNDSPVDIRAEIYPLVVLIGSRRQFNGGFLPRKIGVSNSYGLMEAMKRLERRFNPTPLEFVKIKNKDGEEETEIKARLDPDFEQWLKSLKNGDVCQFCGYKITRIQKYCHYCGVPLLKLEDSLKTEENISKKGIEIFIGV